MFNLQSLRYKTKYSQPDDTFNNFDDYRFERKFLNRRYNHYNLERLVKVNNAHFREIYHERFINNIYLDTPDMDMFYANYNGNSKRMKFRVRWYGELFGEIKTPVLEIKVRNGELNRKESFEIKPFVLNKEFYAFSLITNILESDIPPDVKVRVRPLKPVLLNRYRRKYFLSADGNFRITIDSDLNFYKIQSFENNFMSNLTENHITVLELKYGTVNDKLSHFITNQLPFRLTKSSKYMMGISSTHNLPGF